MKVTENGIKIYDGRSKIFPPDWLKGKINATATAPDSSKIGMDTTIINTAMDKYPAGMIKKELMHVYLVGKLQFSGEIFFGTNSRWDVYIASDNNNVVEKTFHHEFSSILLRRYSAFRFEDKWKKLSPGSLNTTSSKALKKGYNSPGFEPELLEIGYLDLYSLSNWENDFNMYAENIFAGDPAFWKIADTYSIVKEKMKLAVELYTKVNPIFTESYFRFLVPDPKQ